MAFERSIDALDSVFAEAGGDLRQAPCWQKSRRESSASERERRRTQSVRLSPFEGTDTRQRAASEKGGGGSQLKDCVNCES